MYHVTVSHSNNLQEACNRLTSHLQDWAENCIAAYQSEPAIEMHDQLTYTICFPLLIQKKGYQAALEFMKAERDKVQKSWVAQGEWNHGYWKFYEAHHGTEHFDLFLHTLYRLDPSDTQTKQDICNVADMILGENENVPKWVDPETGLFYSMYLGSEKIGDPHTSGLNIAEHIRFVRLLLFAYEVSGAEKYLDFSKRYMNLWANAICSGDKIPLGLTSDAVVYDFDEKNEVAYRNFAGMIPKNMHRNLDRAENIFASEGVDVFLALYKLTHESHYLISAQRLLDSMIDELGKDPDAACLAHTIRLYRNITKDTRYDDAVLRAAKEHPIADIDTLSLEKTVRPGVKETGRRESGLGKRADLSIYYENDSLRVANPLLNALAAEIAMDETLAQEAVDLADAYFMLAQQAFESGREHGCSAQTVNAITRGHGRENNAGMITAVLEPIVACFDINLN